MAATSQAPSLASQMRWRLKSLVPPQSQMVEMPKEPTDHRSLDSGLTNRVLYLSVENWFPKTQGVLPEHTNRASRLLKATENDQESIINPAEQIRLNKLLKQDITVGLEKKRRLEKPLNVSKRLKLMREERDKTAGKKWFDLSRPVMTEELRQELTVLRLMKYAKPGQSRRGAASIGTEKHFEMGSVVAPASAYYTDRATSSADGSVRKSAKLGFVDSLLQDQDYRKYAKRKRQEQQEKQQRNAKRSKPPAKRS